MCDEVIFGGVGTGLITMIVYAIITMFLVGLMIGRTPEIFGKKLEPHEMIMAVVVLLSSTLIQLAFSAIGVSHDFGLSSMNNAGPHGFSEILYAFVSMAANNGSAFAGLNGNTPFFNLAGALVMFVGRFFVIVPALAIAGSLVQKKMVPKSAKFPTASPLFVVMLVSVVLSQLISNVPLVALYLPVLKHAGAGTQAYMALAAASTRIRKLEQGSATPATIPQPVVPAVRDSG